MSQVDQFESLFRAATKRRYRRTDVGVAHAVTITDLPAAQAEAFGQRIRQFLPPWAAETTWSDVPGPSTETVTQLLGQLADQQPQLVCTYRNLHTDTWRWPYSLGEHLDVLTQISDVPVLVLPHPNDPVNWVGDHGSREVMAITDHLTGDDQLVSWAAEFTLAGGTLFLTHVEDQKAFDRNINVIGKIATLDTDVAREEIQRQLLKEPREYVESARTVLLSERANINVKPLVEMGDRVGGITGLIDAHGVDLVVMNTKDDNQLAMRGLAHALAVELRQVPILML